MANLLQEIMVDFSGGQNASVDPSLLQPNGYASAVNCTNSNGVLQPRWGFRRIALDFSDTPDILNSNGVPVPVETFFRAGRFQALIPYSVGGDQSVLVIIGGYLFLIHQDTYKVDVLNLGDPLNVNASRINWSPAGRFLVDFDYPAVPMILEGLNVRRSDPTKNEVPVSVIGGYNQNLLMIGNAGNEFAFSDPASYGFPDGPITFSLIELPSTGFTGQVFQLSTNYGNDPISAMGFLQQVDTTTGIGPAIISTAKQTFSYNTQFPRTAWLNNQFGSVLLNKIGIAGQRAQTNINSDLLFIGSDAQIRALSMSRYEQGRWGNFPISIEVGNYTVLNDKSLAQYLCAGYFNNKAFFGANPFRTHGIDIDGNSYTDYACAGFVVMELNSISGLQSRTVPTWGGLWTGIRPMDIVENDGQCFVMSKDPGYGNALYVIDPTITYDVIDGKERNVRSIFYSRAFNFQQPDLNKLLHSVNVTINGIEGDFSLEASYKPEHAPNYTFWRDYQYSAPVQQCSSLVQAPNGAAGHSIRDFYLGGVPDENLCVENTQDTYSTFKKVQVAFEIIGRNWNFTGFQVRAELAAQAPTEVLCEQFPPVILPLQCLKDWQIYNPGCDI